MWLLSTGRAELHYFARNFDVVGGYAVLSHTWAEGGEQSLQEVRAIGVQCRTNGTNPRDDPELSSKIRECCILAEKHGYCWLWIDSCCIDKTSSSELSEAINSMYKWYQSSEVCYAYLKDVPSDDILQSPNSAFWNSRWHTRGWTLQELIAPDSVIFLSGDWCQLGTRGELALLLQMITGLPVKLMLGMTRPAQYSACIRMSWASKRQTTRIEDEAYCLMGLFGVNMPTNYGEGKRAFLRLQYEIMQHKECDMSLFAFGEPLLPNEIIRDGIVFDNDDRLDRDNPWRYLLADSPRHFRHKFEYTPNDLDSKTGRRYPPADSTTRGPFDRVELPRATVTSYGCKFRLPIVTVDGLTFAVILCEIVKRHFGLFLTKDNRANDPQRPRYLVGRSYTRSRTSSPGSYYLARLCDLGNDLYNLTFNGKRVKASWSTIYIVATPSDLDSECATSPHLLINRSPVSRFQLPRWLVDRFIALQFEVDEVAHSDTLQVVSFAHRSRGRFHVCLGTCKEHHGPDKPPLWSHILLKTPVSSEEFTHDCSEDHLDSEFWATRSRAFGDSDRTVRLSFIQSKRTLPEMAVIIHLELSGRIFEDSVLKEGDISLPPLLNSEGDSPCPVPNILDTSWEPRRPWMQVGAFDSDRNSARHTPEAPIRRLLLELSNDRERENLDRPSDTRSQPLPPSSQLKPVTPGTSSLPRAEPMIPLRTPFAQLLRLFSKRRLHATRAQSSNSSPPLMDA